MAFSASDAAFEGFRIVRREPLTIAIWAVVALAFGLGSTFLLLPILGPMMASAPAPGTNISSNQAMAVMASFGRVYLLAFPVFLAAMSVMTCAVYRAVLRPDERGFGRLRFGADELRLLWLWILQGLVYLFVFIIVLLVIGVVGVGIAFATGAANGAGKTSPGAVAIVVLAVMVAYVGMICAMIWVGIRFSFAAPMTFSERRVRLFASLRLTKGHFWSLFGCYLLAFVLMMLLSVVSLTLYGAISTIGMGSITAAATSIFRPDFSSPQAYFTPSRLAYLVFNAGIAAVYYAVGIAPAAAAYRALTPVAPKSRAEVFD